MWAGPEDALVAPTGSLHCCPSRSPHAEPSDCDVLRLRVKALVLSSWTPLSRLHPRPSVPQPCACQALSVFKSEGHTRRFSVIFECPG